MKISIVIPYFDCTGLGMYKKNLIRCLDKLPQNPYIEWVVSECQVNGYESIASSLPAHVRLVSNTSDAILWHKEYLINCGWRTCNADYLGWMDGDVIFRAINVGEKLLQAMHNCKVSTLYSGCSNNTRHTDYRRSCAGVMKANNTVEPICGYGWLFDRSIYDKYGGLYPYHIVGEGDSFMWSAVAGIPERSIWGDRLSNFEGWARYRAHIINEFNVSTLGCPTRLPIDALTHGKLATRGYRTRIRDLHRVAPEISASYFQINPTGGLCWSNTAPVALVEFVAAYFKLRRT